LREKVTNRMDPPSTDFGYLDPDSQKFTSIATSNRRYLFIIDTSCAQRADGLGIAHVIRIIAAEEHMVGAEIYS
jgi:hypothetical protein